MPEPWEMDWGPRPGQAKAEPRAKEPWEMDWGPKPEVELKREPLPERRVTGPSPPIDEEAFQQGIRGTQWYKEFKERHGEEPDLDTQDYDYRRAWIAGARPDVRDPGDKSLHWPSEFKGEGHPNRFVDGVDTLTGLPADPSERAALRVRREAATPRSDTPLARLPQATGEAIQSAGKTAKGLLTGELEPTPENVLPAVASTLTPGVRGAVQVAKSAVETGLPRFTRSPAAQRTAEKLAEVPIVGKPIRDAAKKGLDEFSERATLAATKPTGTIPNPIKAGEHIIHGVKQEQKLMTPPGEIIRHGEETTQLPWQLKHILENEKHSGKPQNALLALIDIAGKGKNADHNALGRIASNVTRQDWHEVQGSVLGHLGVRPGTQIFDPALMLHRYNTELSPGGKTVIFGEPRNPGKMRAHLDQLVIDSAKMEALRRIPQRPGFMASAGLAGWAFAHPLSALTAAVGGRAAAQFLSKNHVIIPLANWSKAYVRFHQSGGTPAAMAALKIATRNLENSADIKIDTDKLVEAMKGGPPQGNKIHPIYNDIVPTQMKLAPRGIKADQMRQSWDNIEDRRGRPTSRENPAEFNKWVMGLGNQIENAYAQEADYQKNWIPTIRPGQLGREAGLQDLESQRIASYEPRRPVPVTVPLPRPRPKQRGR